MKFVPLTLAIMCVAGCAYTPEREFPAYSLPWQSDLSTVAVNSGIKADSQWWQQFNSTELNTLMTALDAQNLDIASAKLRLEQAELQLRTEQADNYPSVSGRLSGSGSKGLDTGTSSASSSGSMSASYDVDVWGSRQAQILAAELDIDSARQSLRNQSVTLQQLLANAYFARLSLLQRQAIASQNVQASEQLLKLINLQYAAGSASGIERAQQRNTLLASQAELLNLNNQLKLNQRVLGALLADTEFKAFSFSQEINAIALPAIELALPAAILRNRPDVEMAYIALQQTDIAVYQASIAGLPGLSLSTSLSLSDLTSLASGWTLGAALSSAATLFDAGKRRRAEDIAQKNVEIALNNLQSVVIDATQELMDSLDNYAYQREAYEIDQVELENNRRLYELSQARYKAGDTDFLTLLNAQRSWFNAQLSLINSYEALLKSAVGVYLAARGEPLLLTNE